MLTLSPAVVLLFCGRLRIHPTPPPLNGGHRSKQREFRPRTATRFPRIIYDFFFHGTSRMFSNVRRAVVISGRRPPPKRSTHTKQRTRVRDVIDLTAVKTASRLLRRPEATILFENSKPSTRLSCKYNETLFPYIFSFWFSPVH